MIIELFFKILKRPMPEIANPLIPVLIDLAVALIVVGFIISLIYRFKYWLKLKSEKEMTSKEFIRVQKHWKRRTAPRYRTVGANNNVRKELVELDRNKKGFRFDVAGVYVIRNTTKNKVFIAGAHNHVHSLALAKFKDAGSVIAVDLRSGDKFTVTFFITQDYRESTETLYSEVLKRHAGDEKYE